MPKIEHTDEMRNEYANRKKAKNLQSEAETESSVLVRRHHREEKPKAQQGYSADLPEAARPRMEEYPMISVNDYEILKSEWEEVAEMVERAREDAVIFLGGVTEEDRTKRSAQIYGDLFEEKFKNRKDVVLVSKDEIQKIADEAKGGDSPVRTALHGLKKIIAANRDKKVVFLYPYFLQELSLRPDFYRAQDGAPTPLHLAIREKAGDDPDLGALCWFEESGKINLHGKVIEGSAPTEVAIRQMKGIEGFMRITRLLAPDRQAMRISFGHGWNLDALATHLVRGKTGASEFKEVLGGKIFENAKGFDITVEKDGEVKMHCRGKDFTIPRERL